MAVAAGEGAGPGAQCPPVGAVVEVAELGADEVAAADRALPVDGDHRLPGAAGPARAGVGAAAVAEQRIQCRPHLRLDVVVRVALGGVDPQVHPFREFGAQPPGGFQVLGQAGDADARTSIRLVLLDALLGQHDAPWLAALDGGAGSPLAGLARVCRSAGWWWPFEKVAVVCERPVALHRDEAGRLDHGDGPALEFPDGFALCAWRGMPVPRAFLKELRTLTPERIRAEENAELRRVMLEYYGYDRYLTDSGAEPVHQDETGTLWRVELVGDEAVVMVEVVNSTPEPDGTRRTYWLRVPPTTRTARKGVAWTFGVAPEAYEPLRQT
ncbi:DUF6745 domain-containing protein [Streptomyces sp. NWU339]|uniref:DUF6745 domain-containing protein n=1 Tax=Streptomyces sp. NWU339 TaxID=2185284 RepID=UPI0035C81689